MPLNFRDEAVKVMFKVTAFGIFIYPPFALVFNGYDLKKRKLASKEIFSQLLLISLCIAVIAIVLGMLHHENFIDIESASLLGRLFLVIVGTISAVGLTGLGILLARFTTKQKAVR